jgi:serine/threonine protein kinase
MSLPGAFKQEDLVFEIDTLPDLQFRVQNGFPVKLGDGTFGVVYEAFDPNDNTIYAVKLLYDNFATRPREFSSLDDTHYLKVCSSALTELPPDLQNNTQIKEALEKGSRGTAEIIARLQEVGVTNWKIVIDALQKHATSTAVQRFINEMEITKKIKRGLQRRGQPGNWVDGTVEIKGGTEKFHQSNAYKLLSSGGYFDSQRTQVSNFALVMDLYPFTLKDLLEKGPRRQLFRIKTGTLAEIFASAAPDELKRTAATIDELHKRVDAFPIDKLPGDDLTERSQVQQRLHNETESLFGYGLLSSMSIRDRVRTALPYLEGITKGLYNLHTVDPLEKGPLFHHDIKPANIFVKADPERRMSFDCALGDLGFVNPELVNVLQTQAPSHDELPLGSLHYRSPEQKEFFDIAMVEVRHKNNGITLMVHDPKFRGSFIEAGDIVVFSKDYSRKQWEILSIAPNNGNISVDIGASNTIAGNGDQTQVVFYKRQGHRTDLFGIGAILYDMITCGESPERFYESIRRFEYSEDPNQRGQPGSVADLLSKYSRVSTGRADDPSLLQIFEPFRHQSEGYYADREVVELILKCMLYKAKGTFYNDAKAPVEAAANLLLAIRSLMQMRNYNITLSDQYANPLVTLEVNERSPLEPNPFPSTILNLQRMSNPATRLAQGIYYFGRLIDALVFSSHAIDNNPSATNSVYLYELLPSRIHQVEANGRLAFTLSNPTYNTENDLIVELEADRVVKLNRDPTDPYIPDHLTFMRRDLQLFYLDHSSGPSGTALTLMYQYLDHSTFGDQMATGDKIVLTLPTGRRFLGTIIEVKKPQLTLRATFAHLTSGVNDLDLGRQRSGELLKATEKDNVAAAYYAQLHPARYYLEMLALHMHQFFFAYSPFTNETRDKIDLRLLREAKPEHLKIAKVSPQRTFLASRPKAPILESIHRQLARMYLRLALYDSPDSYFQGYSESVSNSWRKVIELVAGDADNLRAEIGEALVGDRQAFRFNPPIDLPLKPDVNAEIQAVNNPKNANSGQNSIEPLIDLRKLMRDLLVK